MGILEDINAKLETFERRFNAIQFQLAQKGVVIDYNDEHASEFPLDMTKLEMQLCPRCYVPLTLNSESPFMRVWECKACKLAFAQKRKLKPPEVELNEGDGGNHPIP
jgi:hypothetical protein